MYKATRIDACTWWHDAVALACFIDTIFFGSFNRRRYRCH